MSSSYINVSYQWRGNMIKSGMDFQKDQTGLHSLRVSYRNTARKEGPPPPDQEGLVRKEWPGRRFHLTTPAQQPNPFYFWSFASESIVLIREADKHFSSTPKLAVCVHMCQLRQQQACLQLSSCLSMWITPSSIWITPSQIWITPSQIWIIPSQIWITQSQIWITPSQIQITPSQIWIIPSQIQVNPHKSESPPLESQPPLTNPNHPLSNPNHPLTNLNHPLTNLNHPLTNLNHPFSNPNHPISNLNHPLSNPNHPLSNLNHPLSNPNHPPPNLNHPLSNLNHPLSNLNHPTKVECNFAKLQKILCRLWPTCSFGRPGSDQLESGGCVFPTGTLVLLTTCSKWLVLFRNLCTFCQVRGGGEGLCTVSKF